MTAITVNLTWKDLEKSRERCQRTLLGKVKGR